MTQPTTRNVSPHSYVSTRRCDEPSVCPGADAHHDETTQTGTGTVTEIVRWAPCKRLQNMKYYRNILDYGSGDKTDGEIPSVFHLLIVLIVARIYEQGKR